MPAEQHDELDAASRCCVLSRLFLKDAWPWPWLLAGRWSVGGVPRVKGVVIRWGSFQAAMVAMWCL